LLPLRKGAAVVFKPRQRPLVMLGRASSHNCSCASFEQVLSLF